MSAARRAIGNAVREARRARGLTQDALAEAAGTSQNRLSAIESGRVNAHLDTLARLAAALNLPLVIVPEGHSARVMESPRLAA